MSTKAEKDVDPSVEFLYKTAAQRDPNKRRVKPVEKHLIQTDFGMDDDDSGDSDYNHSEQESDREGQEPEEEEEEEKKEESDEIDVENVENSANSGSEDEEDGDDDDEEGRPSSDENSDDNEPGGGSLLRHLGEEAYISDDDEDYVPPGEREVTLAKTDVTAAKPTTIATPVIPRKEDIKISDIEGALSDTNKLQQIVICCVCLGDITQESDEIVVCDGCGVSVHEGCYGIPDTSSVASTDSSASTEPWFCDACKAGVNPHCELCPNTGGIYKETDAGKWVHIVCALYIPGVAFNDVERLSNVTLFEMPYSKWGAKECSLCEDQRYSQTGVCICCDAGMCRNHFHVTCAQREGLLSEASPEEDIADPFYAYCKQHAEKFSMKAKRKNYLAVQSRIKAQQAEIQVNTVLKTRLQRKLSQHRKTYGEVKIKRPPCWIPIEKMPRPLSSCPNAVRRLNRKAELLGVSTQHNSHAHRDIRKKTGYVPAAFSMEFVSYYMERNIKITQMRARNTELLCQNVNLIEQEKVYRAEYDRLHEDRERLKESSERKAATQLWQILIQHSNGKLSLPEVLKPREMKVKITSSHVVNDAPISPPVNVIHKCGICLKTSDQHLLVRCDECNKRYHLACLDPPLSRMPKKTKLFGWQCQDCSPSTSDESEDDDDATAPRRLRESIKEPRKLLHENTVKSGDRTKKNVPKRTEEKSKSAVSKPEKSGSKKKSGHKRRRVAMMNYSAFGIGGDRTLAPMDCAMCLKKGSKNDMVRCDECTLCYHFPCLTPPQTKSPKRRGSNWLCDACDTTPKQKPVAVKKARSPAPTELPKPSVKRSPPKPPSPKQHKATLTPSKQQATPTSSKQQSPPTASKQQATPTSSKQQAVPTSSKQQAVPTSSKQQAVPTSSKQQATPTPKRRASSESEKTVPVKRMKKTPKKYQDGGALSDETTPAKVNFPKRKNPPKKVKVEIESLDSSSEDEKKDAKLSQGKVIISRLNIKSPSKKKPELVEARSSPLLAKSRNALSSILMKKEREEIRKNAKKIVAKSRR